MKASGSTTQPLSGAGQLFQAGHVFICDKQIACPHTCSKGERPRRFSRILLLVVLAMSSRMSIERFMKPTSENDNRPSDHERIGPDIAVSFCRSATGSTQRWSLVHQGYIQSLPVRRSKTNSTVTS